MELLSRLDLHEVGRRYVLARATKIEPTMVDTRGSDVNLFVGSTAFVAHALIRQLSKGLKSLFLETATGDDLLRWAWDRYQMTTKGAGAARGAVIFSRSSVAIGAGTIPAGTILYSLTGIEYMTTIDATFSSSTLVSTATNVRAVQAGKAFQVGRNQIRRFKTPSAIFDSSITVTNLDPTAGGEDVEGEAQFKERVRDFWRTARRGTLGAIEFGARAVAGVDSAYASEALDGAATPARVVTLYIADSSGVASKQLGDDVRVSLDEYRCGGIAVLPSLSVPQIVTIQLKLVFLAGVETAILTTIIRTAIVEYVNSLGANQVLRRAAISAILVRYQSQGLVAEDSTIIEPAGDLTPQPGYTLRTTISNVTTV